MVGSTNLLIANCVEWGSEHKQLHFPDDVSQWIVDAFQTPSEFFRVWRVQHEIDPPPGPFDGIVLSGSPSSVYDRDPWILRLSDKIREWVRNGTPLLGICFGHQLICQTLGSTVAKNPKGWEVGTCSLEFTEAGKSDPLLKGLSSPFKVMQTHQDIVVETPPGGECLAYSPKCAVQAVRLGDRIRTIQFHPEYTVDHMRFLIGPRRGRLAANGVDVDSILRGLEPLPQVQIVLSNFLRYFISGNTS